MLTLSEFEALTKKVQYSSKCLEDLNVRPETVEKDLPDIGLAVTSRLRQEKPGCDFQNADSKGNNRQRGSH